MLGLPRPSASRSNVNTPRSARTCACVEEVRVLDAGHKEDGAAAGRQAGSGRAASSGRGGRPHPAAHPRTTSRHPPAAASSASTTRIVPRRRALGPSSDAMAAKGAARAAGRSCGGGAAAPACAAGRTMLKAPSWNCGGEGAGGRASLCVERRPPPPKLTTCGPPTHTHVTCGTLHPPLVTCGSSSSSVRPMTFPSSSPPADMTTADGLTSSECARQ